jgi:hypothetical protein
VSEPAHGGRGGDDRGKWCAKKVDCREGEGGDAAHHRMAQRHFPDPQHGRGDDGEHRGLDYQQQRAARSQDTRCAQPP